MMERFLPLIAFVAVSLFTGLLLVFDQTVPLAWGISLFVPALFYLSSSRFGMPITASFSFMVALVLFVVDKRTALNVAELFVAGAAFYFITDLRILVASLTLLMFGGSVFEDVVFGLPEEVLKNLSWLVDVRWGFYFLSSSVLSALFIGTAHVVAKRNFNFKSLSFGYYPIALFILGGIFSLLNFFPEAVLVGRNLVIATFGLFINQGLAVSLVFLEKMGTATKFLLFFVFVFFPVIGFLAAAIIGIFDFWFNFRKLKGGRL